MGLAAGQVALDEDFEELARSSSSKPLVRLVQTVAQACADNTSTAVTFTTETIDTDGYFNAGVSQTRITPTRAGYYRARGTTVVAAAADYVAVQAFIRKTGADIAPVARTPGNGSSIQPTAQTECIIDMNGTTDYVELIINQDNTANVSRNTQSSTANRCVLELEYLRPL